MGVIFRLPPYALHVLHERTGNYAVFLPDPKDGERPQRRENCLTSHSNVITLCAPIGLRR